MTYVVSFYASSDTIITPSDYLLGQRSVTPSNTGVTKIQISGTFPTSIPAGSYYFGWIIDSENAVDEVDETNNTAYKTSPKLTVTAQNQPAISGFVSDVGGAGVASVTLSADNAGGSTTTDSSGSYTLKVPYSWSGWITPTSAGSTFEPAFRTYSAVVADQSGQNYTLQASRLYVDGDARGAGNGSSWANAFNSLQDALAAARQGSEVWVAQGVYTPDNGAGISRGDRSASFGLKSGVAIKGGYAGVGEPNSNARDVKVYATILSGDLGRNDLPGVDPCDLSKQTSRADNSRHVLTAINVDGTAILDGVQVVGGYAEPADTGGPAPASQSQGAGLYISSSELHLRACIFSGNWASVGGGAIYVTDGHAELTGCTLRANAAGDQGGAIDNEGGETWLTGCVICQNAAGISGGGAIWNSNGTLRLVNCTLNGNSSDYGGGAIANAGGGLYATNCCFHANYAKALAGAIYNFLSAKATLWDCTIAGNRQDGYAGTVVCGPLLGQAPNELSITNCILWDGGDEIGNLAKSSIVVTRSDVRGGWFGVGNIDADPLFVAPAGLDSIAGTEDDDLRLGPLSPCIDMGDTTLLPADTADLDVDGDVEEPLPLDLDGRRRVAGNAVDMGAYEYQVSISSCMSDISPLYDGARAGGM